MSDDSHEQGGDSVPATDVDLPAGLADIRAQLDRVDRAMLDALAERQRLVGQVARSKAKGGSVFRDRERESALLARLVELGRHQELDPWFVTRVFREIIEHSLRIQQDLLTDPERRSRAITVGYQGGPGAFSHLASQRYFAARPARFRGHQDFRSLLDAVRKGDIDYALLPIENTTAGSINESYDLLAEMDLHIVGEEVQPVEHCLVGFPDTPLESLRRVYSHPVALAQCRAFLGSLPGCRAEAHRDTALAVVEVAAEGDPTQAAIASAAAAELHGLSILQRGIQDQRHNYTRMVVVAREPEEVDPRVTAKTSCIFATRHEGGALASAIACLAGHGINMTKLESRPQPGAPWEYRFYLDFEGNPAADPEVEGALRDFSSHTRFLRVLGTYAARTGEAGKPSSPTPKLGSAKAKAPLPLDVVPAVAPVRLAGRLLGEDPPLLLVAVGEVEVAAESAALALEYGASGVLVLGAAGRSALEQLAGIAHGRELPLGLPFLDSAGLGEALRSAELLVVPRDLMGYHRLLAEAARGGAPMVLPRGRDQSDEDWLAAAEACRSAGNGRVVLCEEPSGRPDFAAFAELVERQSYPVLMLVPGDLKESESTRLAKLALAAGAAGVVAYEPSRATLAELAELF